MESYILITARAPNWYRFFSPLLYLSVCARRGRGRTKQRICNSQIHPFVAQWLLKTLVHVHELIINLKEKNDKIIIGYRARAHSLLADGVYFYCDCSYMAAIITAQRRCAHQRWCFNFYFHSIATRTCRLVINARVKDHNGSNSAFDASAPSPHESLKGVFSWCVITNGQGLIW